MTRDLAAARDAWLAAGAEERAAAVRAAGRVLLRLCDEIDASLAGDLLRAKRLLPDGGAEAAALARRAAAAMADGLPAVRIGGSAGGAAGAAALAFSSAHHAAARGRALEAGASLNLACALVRRARPAAAA